MTCISTKTAGHLVSDSYLPENTLELYQFADVKDANEAVIVLFHAFMLEYGFKPKAMPAEHLYKYMPQNWNEKGFFKIKYEHMCCPSYNCYMTCIPLYSNVCVNGIICDVDCSESINLTMNMNHYLKKKADQSDVYKTFSSIDELSRHFKDHFCLLLLNLLHETIGVNRFYGLRGLVDDIKIPLFKFLPVESIIALSAVNKDYHHLANSPFLWKYLFKRDFCADGVPDIDEDKVEPSNWKQMYIKRYRKKKEAQCIRHSRIPHSNFDDDDFGISRYFEPRNAFPSILPAYFDPPDVFPSILPTHPMIPRFFR